MRADSPASSMSVATLLRKLCELVSGTLVEVGPLKRQQFGAVEASGDQEGGRVGQIALAARLGGPQFCEEIARLVRGERLGTLGLFLGLDPLNVAHRGWCPARC